MPAPHHIIAAPYTIYLAPVGTIFPRIDEPEASFDPDWFKLGAAGAKDYDEAGVTVSHDQSLEYFRGADSTVPRKAFRTEEDLLIGLTLADLSPEQYAKILNDAAVRTVVAAAGVAGEQSFNLYQGPQAAFFALLARGMSTVDNDLVAQYEVESCIQDGTPAPVYTKGTPALLEAQFRAMDATGEGNMGTLRTQTARALAGP